jgi:heme-degrading monooxygenase HmoA
MIGRVWEGTVSAEKADAYGQYLADFGVEDYRKVAGNRGVSLLRRDVAGMAHFLLVSYWTSHEALEAYAGSDIEKATYYAYDLECLIDPSPTVRHYEVVANAVALDR